MALALASPEAGYPQGRESTFDSGIYRRSLLISIKKVLLMLLLG